MIKKEDSQNIKLIILTILKLYFGSVEYIHIVTQEISWTFSFCKIEIVPIKHLSTSSSTQTPKQSLLYFLFPWI
jgi:hypothetical protein